MIVMVQVESVQQDKQPVLTCPWHHESQDHTQNLAALAERTLDASKCSLPYTDQIGVW